VEVASARRRTAANKRADRRNSDQNRTAWYPKTLADYHKTEAQRGC
jgi:hypothetical protein